MNFGKKAAMNDRVTPMVASRERKGTSKHPLRMRCYYRLERYVTEAYNNILHVPYMIPIPISVALPLIGESSERLRC